MMINIYDCPKVSDPQEKKSFSLHSKALGIFTLSFLRFRILMAAKV